MNFYTFNSQPSNKRIKGFKLKTRLGKFRISRFPECRILCVDLISGTTYQAEYLVLDVICRGHVAVSLHKFEIRNVASGKRSDLNIYGGGDSSLSLAGWMGTHPSVILSVLVGWKNPPSLYIAISSISARWLIRGKNARLLCI